MSKKSPRLHANQARPEIHSAAQRIIAKFQGQQLALVAHARRHQERGEIPADVLRAVKTFKADEWRMTMFDFGDNVDRLYVTFQRDINGKPWRIVVASDWAVVTCIPHERPLQASPIDGATMSKILDVMRTL